MKKKKIFILLLVLVVILLFLSVLVLHFTETKEQVKKPKELDKKAIAIEAAENQNTEENASYQVVKQTKRENGDIEYLLENEESKKQTTFVVESDGSVYQEIKMQTSANESEISH